VFIFVGLYLLLPLFGDSPVVKATVFEVFMIISLVILFVKHAFMFPARLRTCVCMCVFVYPFICFYVGCILTLIVINDHNHSGTS
jgi:hypothetical protein